MQITRAKKKFTTQGKTQSTKGKPFQDESKRKTKEGENKSAKPAQQQSRNQRKKTSNENNNTVCVHKTATTGGKTQGKKKTIGKNYFERKIISAQTLKARKGVRTAKQRNEANLGNSPSAQTGQNIFFGFSFKKKPSQLFF